MIIKDGMRVERREEGTVRVSEDKKTVWVTTDDGICLDYLNEEELFNDDWEPTGDVAL